MNDSINPSEKDSDFFSPERVDTEAILKQYHALADNHLIRMIADAIPDVAMILSETRQVVYLNKAVLDLIGMAHDEALLGRRTGELFNCIHAAETDEGCGTTDSCRYCGALRAIIRCQQSGEAAISECRITSEKDGQPYSYDLKVKASPFDFDGNRYIIFAVSDISDQKRRKVLERMFFHDILNTATGLSGILTALRGVGSQEELSEFIDIAEKASNDLIEDLVSQRALSAAEAGDLELKIERVSSVSVLHDVAAYLMHHEVSSGKRIVVDPFSHQVQLETDVQLLKRVLINLVKNGLEASPSESVISLGARVGDRSVRFWVNNPSVMSDGVRKQIFQRSFSTKGENRGIGTYSVKLLTTRYLKGKVEFESTEENGTTFFVELPFSLII